MSETVTPLWTDDMDTIDLSNYDHTAKAALIPRGKYPAYVDESELTESQAGEAMIKLTFKLNDTENAEFDGRTMRRYYLLTREFGIRDLKKDGVTLNNEINWTAFRPTDCADYFDGKPCVLDIIQKKRKDNGEMGNEIKAVLPAQGGDFWSQ